MANLAVLRAAVFSLSTKMLRGADTRPPAVRGLKLSLLNSVDYPEYPDRKVGARAWPTSSAYCGLWSRQFFHSKDSD